MRAHVANTASLVLVAATAAISILNSRAECLAQATSGGPRLRCTIYNRSDYSFAPSDLELWLIRDGSEDFLTTTPVGAISTDRSREIYFQWEMQDGRRYRVVFHADCANDALKAVYFKSRSFVFRFDENWRRIDIDNEDVISRPRGNLIRPELKTVPAGQKVSTADDDVHNDFLPAGARYPERHEIFVKPRDLIEFDYFFEGTHKVVPKGGSHSDVLSVSAIGPRSIINRDAKPVGKACYFEAKSIGDDWVSVEIDGHPRRYHIWVQE